MCVMVWFVKDVDGEPWSEILERLPERLNGQSHDIEKRPVDGGDGDVSDPVLDAVGTGLVERVGGADVMVDLGVGQNGEGHVGGAGKGDLLPERGQTNAGVDLMGLSGEETQHPARLVGVRRLAEREAVGHGNDGVGSDDQRLVSATDRDVPDEVAVGIGLAPGKEKGNLVSAKIGRIGLVNVLDDMYGKVDAEIAQQGLPAWRGGREEDGIRFSGGYHGRATGLEVGRMEKRPRKGMPWA